MVDYQNALKAEWNTHSHSIGPIKLHCFNTGFHYIWQIMINVKILLWPPSRSFVACFFFWPRIRPQIGLSVTEFNMWLLDNKRFFSASFRSHSCGGCGQRHGWAQKSHHGLFLRGQALPGNPPYRRWPQSGPRVRPIIYLFNLHELYSRREHFAWATVACLDHWEPHWHAIYHRSQ